MNSGGPGFAIGTFLGALAVVILVAMYDAYVHPLGIIAYIVFCVIVWVIAYVFFDEP